MFYASLLITGSLVAAKWMFEAEDDSEEKSKQAFQVKSKTHTTLLKADRYLQAGKIASACRLYTRYIQKEGTDVSAFYFQRGCAYLHQKRYREAYKDGTMVINLKPHLSHGYSLRAYAALHLDRLESALTDYESAIEQEGEVKFGEEFHLHIPNLWGTYPNTATAQQQQQQQQQQQPQQQQQQKQHETDDGSSSSSGSGGSGTPGAVREKKVTFLEQTGNAPVEILPSNKDMLLGVLASLGNRYIEAGENKKASRHLTRALELAPENFGNWVIHMQLAQCFVSLKEGKEALRHAESVIHHRPSEPQGYFLAGKAHAINEQYTEALASFNRALTLNPLYGEAMRQRDEILAKVAVE